MNRLLSTPTARRTLTEGTLLDAALPAWDHRSRHTIRVDETPAALLATVDELTWREVPVFRLLLTLRGIAGPGVTPSAPVLSWFTSAGFGEVARTDDELLIVSTQPVRGGLRPATPLSIAAFRAFDEPGYVRIAFNFTVADGVLATETRVLATDPRARRRFAVYWSLIRAGSGLIRRVWLRAIRSRARPTRPSTAASVVRLVDDRVVKRGMRLLLRGGLAPRAFALLETTGRRTGQPRHTPVGNGLVGETFWLAAARGEAADYVKNLRANPAVRVKIGRRWRSGLAEVLPDDDPRGRLNLILAHFGRLRRVDARALESSIRLLGSTPVVVRIRPRARPSGRRRPMPSVRLTAGTIDYLDTGGDGSTLVLLHGVNMDASRWEAVVQALGPGVRCVCPTLPLGSHRRPMDRPELVTHRGVAALVGELLDALELTDVTLVLNDCGGAQLLLAEDGSAGSARPSSSPARPSPTSRRAVRGRRSPRPPACRPCSGWPCSCSASAGSAGHPAGGGG